MIELLICEIQDWRDETRLQSMQACGEEAARLLHVIDMKCDDLSLLELAKPTSTARKEIESEITAALRQFNTEQTAKLQASLGASYDEIEEGDGFSGANWSEKATIAAGGATAFGAAGLAVGAAAAIPTTTTLFFVVPAAAGSWPLFLALGAGALTAAAFSPTAMAWGHEKLISRYKAQLSRWVHDALLNDSPTAKRKSSLVSFRRQIDQITLKRIEDLSA